ncbi:MAG TPA: beta-galactosidase [Rhizomicrobium sp.]|nr:beta-galactosidase [Rhizomicrobium sp.]
MNPPLRFAAATLAALIVSAPGAPAKSVPPIPELVRQHGTTQLIVDGKPFLMIGGELDNSSASSAAFLQPVWPRLVAMNFNTVLAPVTWELIEPQEGKFDFRSVDDLIGAARKHRLHLVPLWFGSWKTSMSSYVPAWVKRDQDRFPRAVRSDGRGMEMLSAFGANNLEADGRAFAALMQRLKERDGTQHTVVMVQVENEVGMISEARDHGAAADAAFAAPVPASPPTSSSSPAPA